MRRSTTAKSLVALLFVVCMVSAAASSSCAEKVATGEVTLTAVLQHIKPTAMMWALGAVSASDYTAGKCGEWHASNQLVHHPTAGPPTVDGWCKSAVDLSGIDSIAPVDSNSTLIVRGQKSAVTRLLGDIKRLDVPHKQIQIRAEIVQTPCDDGSKLLSLVARSNEWTPNAAAATKEAVDLLRAAPNGVIASPIVLTQDNTPASSRMVWQDGDYAIETALLALPRVNEDKTITVLIRLSSRQTAMAGADAKEERVQEIFTSRRLADGESVVLGGFVQKTRADGPGQNTFVILTPTIVK